MMEEKRDIPDVGPSLIANPTLRLRDVIANSVVEMSLTARRLEVVPIEILQFSQLKILDMTYNLLKDFPMAFTALKLRHLNLSHNAFHAIPDSLRTGFPDLMFLDISWNWIQEFDTPPAFLTTIRSIDLSDNNLYQVPPWIFHAKCKIEFVNLSHNAFITPIEPIELGRVNLSIRHLNLENCALRQSSFLKSLIGLDELNIGNSYIPDPNQSELNMFRFLTPEDFCHVKKLNLTSLRLAVVPNALTFWKNLVYLDVSENILHYLPESIDELKCLQTGIFSKNLISYLPNNLIFLKNLVALRLDSNKIESLPQDFYKLKNLRTLDLYNNCLYDVNILIHMDINAIDLEMNYMGNEKKLFSKYFNKCTELRNLYDIYGRTNGSKPIPVEEVVQVRLAPERTPESDGIVQNFCERFFSQLENVAEDWDFPDPDENEDFDPNIVYKKSKDIYPTKSSSLCPADAHSIRLGTRREMKRNQPYADVIVDGQFDSD